MSEFLSIFNFCGFEIFMRLIIKLKVLFNIIIKLIVFVILVEILK